LDEILTRLSWRILPATRANKKAPYSSGALSGQ